MADRFEWNKAELDNLFNSTDGPVSKHLARMSIKVENRAKQLAPVDTGRLRASVTHDLGRDAEGLVARVGTDVEYAPHQEFGTVRMPAHPFLRPALDAVRGGTP